MNLYFKFFSPWIILFIYLMLFVFFPVKSYLLTKKINFIDKPVIYSTNSLLIPDLNPEYCIDRNLTTSCYEICSPKNYNVSKEIFLFLNQNECGFVIEISPTHIMYQNPPEKNFLFQFGLYLSQEDLLYKIPKKIKLILYEQQLYHINRDYRFPDQPQYSLEIEINVEKKIGWQFWDLQTFNQTINDSSSFPDNIKQRWFKILIEDVYNSDKEKISITEFYYKDLFLNPNEYK